MNSHVDAYSEGSLKGYFYKPIAMAAIFTLRRFGTLRNALSNDLIALCLHASPMYKDGSKLVKIVYLDINQMAQLILSFDSAYYDGPCMDRSPWIHEAELMQVYRIKDLNYLCSTSP